VVHQALGIIPLSQAILWEIFPLGRRAKPADESAGRVEPLPSAVE